MSIRAHTNAVGSYSQYQPLEWTQRSRYWSSEWNSWNYDPEFHLYSYGVSNRSEKTETVKTSIVKIDGRPVRPATSYRRYAGEFTYKSETVDRQDGPNSYTFWSGNACDRAWEYIDPPQFSGYLGILDTDEHRKAVVECLLRMNEGKVNIGQFLGEAISSANMLADAGSSFVRLLLDVRRGRWKNIDRRFSLQGANNEYLRWKFGWQPLAADLHGLYDLYQEGLRLPPFVTARRTVKSQRHGTTAFTGYKPAAWTVKSRDQVMLMAKVDAPGMAAAQSYSLANPLATAWELVPVSFVVDWFMPIGNSLQALTASCGLSFVTGYHSQTRELECTAESVRVGSVTVRAKNFARQAYGSFPTAQFYANDDPFGVKRNGVKSPFLTSKVETFLSLWTQLTGRNKVLS